MWRILGQGVVRALSGIFGTLFLIVMFLKWETTWTAIPGDAANQVDLLVRLGGAGWLPVLTTGLIGVVLFAVAIGSNKLGAWRNAASNYMNRETLLRADNERLR